VKGKVSKQRTIVGASSVLEKLGIQHESGLVLHLPLRYDDETRLCRIADTLYGQTVQVEGVVVSSDIKYRPKRQLVSTIEDGSGTLVVRLLNFYPNQAKQFSPGARVRLFGEIREGFFGAEMVHPKYQVVREDATLSETLTPVYPTTAGLSQSNLRRMIERALVSSTLDDTLPADLLIRLKLPSFADSIRFLHTPPADAIQQALQERTHPAWRRVKFDELLAQQLSMRIHRDQRQRINALPLAPRDHLTRALLERLPFKLTSAQQRAAAEIRNDLAQPYPMRRLLQGDVGSGKTVVAALAALQAIERDIQVAVMAPTEILGEQHYRKFSAWLAPFGITVTWLTGGLSRAQKRVALAQVVSGAAQITIGTHALFQDEVEFRQLGLVIIDEQHRFGVRQRLALGRKGEKRNALQPHQLMMSATPIPRTLAMSYYADLDVSMIDELPPGRTPVATRLVDDKRRDEVTHRVRDACISGSQAYWVCPLIEESEALQLQTALETYERVAAMFSELKVGLVHGRLKSEEKAAVMAAFQRGAIQLLVATTVIEVGVDVPNATLMVIEHAERMGLAQLHQLRGRVGRSGEQSTCILLYQAPLSSLARERLKIIYENNDGFEIARHDLRLRGPGELLGARQSGLPLLRFADLNTDIDLLDAARSAADVILKTRSKLIVQRHLERWLGERQRYLSV